MLCVMVSYSVVTLNLAQLCSIIGVVTASCTIGQVHLLVLYKAEKPSVCLSDRRKDISAVSAWIETGFTLNESCVLWHQQVYF